MSRRFRCSAPRSGGREPHGHQRFLRAPYHQQADPRGPVAYPDDLTNVSKIGARRGEDASWLPAFEPDELARAVEDNLRNLELDALDVVNLCLMFDVHGPAEGSLAKPLKAVTDLQRRGLVRHIGLSNVTPAQYVEARATADIVCVQNQYNLGRSLDLDDLGVGEDSGSLSFRSVVSWLDNFKIQDREGQPFRNYAGTIGRAIETGAGVAHPEWKANTNLTYANGPFDIGLTWVFIDRMKHSNLVATPTATTLGIKRYSLFNLNIGYTFEEQDIEVSVGSSNIFNTAPPSYSDTPSTYDGSLYDVVGRTFFGTVSKKF